MIADDHSPASGQDVVYSRCIGRAERHRQPELTRHSANLTKCTFSRFIRLSRSESEIRTKG